MRLLALPSALALLALTTASALPEYTEHLHLQPLPNNHLHATFNFTATTPLSAYESNHFRYFPRSLAQILQYTHTQELHLRFALGRWDEENWGSRPLHGTREGGTGVELWAWVQGDEDGGKETVEERWSGLVNSLSGLFCASLNFVDGTRTTRPLLTFQREGSVRDGEGRAELLHGSLPHEVVCTENLTPFLKLLPCKGKAGISSLLDGHKLFDASWQSMAVDVRPVCHDVGQGEEGCVLEIQQTVSMALSLPRSVRDRHNPIPRPPPIEEIECDESKPWNGHDTCYPKTFDGETAWSLSQIFGRPIRGSCPIAQQDENTSHITLSVPSARTVNATGSSSSTTHPSSNSRSYKLSPNTPFDLSLPRESLPSHSPLLHPPPLHASRLITGSGQERGGMHISLRNPHAHPQKAIYMESLPWYLRPYMHTLRLAGNGRIKETYYKPALDRARGTQLELVLEIAAHGSVELSYEFEKAVLRYTEYPPDANRGFDVAPAVLRILPPSSNSSSSSQGQDQYLRTTPLLLPLPTPDFSMPYNVIILTSTVIALGFGSIFNLLIRRFVLVEEIPKGPLAGVVERVRGVVAKLRGQGGGDAEGKGKGKRGEKGDGIGLQGRGGNVGENGRTGDGMRSRKPPTPVVMEE